VVGLCLLRHLGLKGPQKASTAVWLRKSHMAHTGNHTGNSGTLWCRTSPLLLAKINEQGAWLASLRLTTGSVLLAYWDQFLDHTF
jgi:hypothetical protein